jgi:hypothetical protein
VAAMIFWSAFLSPRFRHLTGRDEERYPEQDYYRRDDEEDERPHRSKPPPIPD